MPEKIKKYTDKSRVFIKGKFTDDGAGWLFLQQIIIAPMSLLTTVLLAKVLSISDYGYYKYVLSIYSIVAIFGLTGFYNISSLNIQRGEDSFFYLGFKYRKLFRWIPAIFSLFIALYYFIMGNNFFGIIFLISIFSHLFVDLYDFYTVMSMGRGNFKLNAKLAIINYFVSFFPPVLVAYFTSNLYFVFGTMFLFQFLFRFITFKYVKRKLGFYKIGLQGEISEEDDKDFKRQSLSLSFNGSLTILNVNGSSAIVFNRLGPESNAVYSLAITFADFVFGIISAPLSKTLLVLSHMTKNKANNYEKVNLINRLTKKYFWLALFAMLATMLVLPLVYKLLFAKYLFSYKFAVVYSLSILSIAFYPAYQYFYETRKIKLLNTIQIFTLIVGLFILFFSSMYFGLWGAIIVAIILRFGNYFVASMMMKKE